MTDEQTLIAHTKKWLSTVVIGHGLCPFAKREFEAGRVHYTVIETADISAQLEAVIDDCIALDKHADRETSLLIFPAGLSEFQVYLDVLDTASELLRMQGYEGVYQLASFHPDYCFAGVSPDDASQYTNRSPYPMIHILREASVEAATKTYPDAKKIADRNIELTRGLGAEFMRNLRAECFR